MTIQPEHRVDVTAAQIRSEREVSAKRGRASARLLARPINFAANLLTLVWTILKAIGRP